MLEKNRRKTVSEKKAESKDRNLRIFRNNFPLSTTEMQGIMRQITDEDIAKMAVEQPKEIKGKCIMGYYVGAGTCLAKKLGKYGMKVDAKCKDCKHEEILHQLNYIFKLKFEGKYRAEWVSKRSRKNKAA
jgi:hypothetical protein